MSSHSTFFFLYRDIVTALPLFLNNLSATHLSHSVCVHLYRSHSNLVHFFDRSIQILTPPNLLSSTLQSLWARHHTLIVLRPCSIGSVPLASCPFFFRHAFPDPHKIASSYSYLSSLWTHGCIRRCFQVTRAGCATLCRSAFDPSLGLAR